MHSRQAKQSKSNPTLRPKSCGDLERISLLRTRMQLTRASKHHVANGPSVTALVGARDSQLPDTVHQVEVSLNYFHAQLVFPHECQTSLDNLCCTSQNLLRGQ